jgi:hypothetical protein
MAKDVKISTRADIVKVWVDGHEVPLKDGSATVAVEPGAHHALSWAARGAPGSSYSVDIVSPDEAKLTRGDTFDEGGFDAGVAWFKVALGVALAASLAAASPAAAQPASAAGSAALSPSERAAVLDGAWTRSADPTGHSAVATNTFVTLEGSSGGRMATAQLGVATGNLALAFALKGAVDGDTKQATFGDLNGLRDKSSLDVSLTWSHWDLGDPAPKLLPACEEFAAATGAKLEDIPCSLLALKRDKTAAGKAALKSILRRLDPGTVYFTGIRAAVAPEAFTFTNVPDLTSRTQRHTSWSVTTNAGVLTSQSVLLAGHYTYEVAYLGGGNSQLCQPVTSTSSLVCSDRIIGGPAREASNLIGGEIRKFFGARVAVSPRVNVDAAGGNTLVGIEVPLYFLRSGEGGLTGGAMVGWRSDDRSIVVSAFVGEVLGLLTR